MAQVIKNRLVKIVLSLALSLLLLLLLLAGAIQFPYVQTKLVNYLSLQFSEKIDHKISLEHIYLWWFDTLEIEGVSILDPESNKMIQVNSLEVNFDLSGLLQKNDHHIDEIQINGANVLLTKVSTEEDSVGILNINNFIRKIKDAARKSGEANRVYISCDKLSISNSVFNYNDQFKDSINNQFDYSHFSIDSINGVFENIYTVKDTFSMNVKKLRGFDTATGMRIKNMKSNFSVSQSAMEFADLELFVGNSMIKDSIRFDYSSTAELSDFNNRVLINAQLDKSVINTRDLAFFAPQLAGINEVYTVSGKMNGLVKAFLFSKASISFGSGSAIRGKIRMNGLPNLDETFIDFDLSDSFIKTEDVRPYVKKQTYLKLAPFNYVSFTAEFLGYPNDFVATGNFFTEHGRIDSDINLKLADDISKTSYSGGLVMTDFDLGGYFKTSELGIIDLKGNIKGSGFTLETADFKLDGEIKNINVKDYKYENITTNARFTKEFFEGELKIDDKNISLDANGSIDLRGGLNFFNIKARLDTINLKTLKLTEEDFFIKSDAYVNARGLKIDEILGAANFGSTYLAYRNKSIKIDTMSIISDKDEEERIIFLRTNLLNAKITGEFDLTQFYANVKELYKEYELSIKNDFNELTKYYSSKDNIIGDYDMDYEIDIKDLNPFLNVFAPGIYISPQSTVTGNFTGGYTSIVSLETNLDSLVVGNNYFLRNDFQVNISKISDSTNVLASAYLFSETQSLSEIKTRDLFFEGIWDNNRIDYEFDIYQTQYDNSASLLGSVEFLNDTVEFKIQTADLKILEEQWQIDNDNYVSVSGNNIEVSNFSLFNNNQRISIEGVISDLDNSIMNIQIDSVQLDNLNTVLNKNISGNINGDAQIRDVYKNMLVENSILIDGLTFDDFLIGNINAVTSWNNEAKRSNIQADLEREGYKILDINGTYSPYEEEALNLKADLKGTELKIAEPFLSSFFSDIEGALYGEVLITGSPTKPYFKGSGKIDSAQLHINYLNTDYTFFGEFYLTPDKIGFENINLNDANQNKASLNGYISHNNFKDMAIDISTDFNSFQLLNTASEDNSLFYGNGIATGTVNFDGPLKNMTISADARTEKGTRIYIPIGDSQTIQKEEYIDFVDFDVTNMQSFFSEVESVDLRGIKLDFDLNITNDAYCEIIFDIKAGDIIRGRGNGDINLQIDTKGDFNMFGDFNIEEGGYNFTLYNLINKEFEILTGSKITWYGDPYQGILDINASYNQLASFIPILPDRQGDDEFQYSDVIELRRKYPVNVMLDIDGVLLSPNVEFDIKTGSLPRNVQLPNGDPPIDLEFEFVKFKNIIDEQELKRQVFSLIILRRFSPLLSFNTSGGDITSSVSELLSNQLSYWITQVDENLEIDVDFGNLDQEAFNTFQLRLSYTFLDGRLRVTRDGGFTNQTNQADVSSIAGDWTVEYLLTDDGKFKVKMYNRTNYNPINPTEENQNTVTTGFSLIHTQSFDELKDLFKKKRENLKSDKIQEEDLEINTKASNSKNAKNKVN